MPTPVSLMYPSAWSRFVLEMYPGFVVIRNGKDTEMLVMRKRFILMDP